ncbi:MAG: PA2169 family four-helix-bundle protein [Edaphocola sp.]
MMENSGAEALNDLILMNNDRLRGYSKTMDLLEGQDKDLLDFFQSIAVQTQHFLDDLGAEVKKSGCEVEMHTSVSGKLHLAWIALKATFVGKNRKTLLEECARGEQHLQNAYMDALNGDAPLKSEQWELISDQLEQLKATLAAIKEKIETAP